MQASPPVLRVSSRAVCHGRRPTLTIGPARASRLAAAVRHAGGAGMGIPLTASPLPSLSSPPTEGTVSGDELAKSCAAPDTLNDSEWIAD